MGRNNLQHIDRGVIYLPIYEDSNVDEIIKEHQDSGKTIVLLRSGKRDIEKVLRELLKTRLNT